MRRLVMTLALCAAVTAAARADPIADFYRGRTVQLVLGYGPGGGYDVYARLVARFLGGHIPGAPAVVVVNMPGAGSLRAANYLAANAARDGSVIGAFARDMPLLGVIGGDPAVQFDPLKLAWIGSPSSSQDDSYLLMARKDAAVASIADARKPGGPPLVVAGTAPGASGDDVATLLKATLGLNLKIIAGYPDSGAMFLAVDRREVDGRFVGLSAIRSSKPDWLKPEGGLRALMQFARVTRNPAFPDAPTARELAPDARSRALIELAELPYLLARPLAAPPGVPPERLKALRDGFDALAGDAAFLEAGARLGLDISPIGAAEATKLVNALAATPRATLDELKRLQGSGG